MKTKDILLTAFCGSNNSSKILVDKIPVKSNYDKLDLQNNRNTSVEQLKNKIINREYDYIFAFGQKPVIKDKVYIETTGKNGSTLYRTDLEFEKLYDYIYHKGYQVKISNNAGTSYCNNIYFHGLDYIYSNNLHTKMIFIHIPFIKCIADFDKLVNLFTGYLYDCC